MQVHDQVHEEIQVPKDVRGTGHFQSVNLDYLLNSIQANGPHCCDGMSWRGEGLLNTQ